MHRRRQILRALDGELGPRATARLRHHLRGCADCRAYYDQQLRLLRALHGDVQRPCASEQRHELLRALEGIGLQQVELPRQPFELLPGWLLSPARLAASAALLLALLLGGALVLRQGWLGPRPAPLAGQLVRVVATRLAGEPAARGGWIRAGEDVEVSESGLAEIALERGGTLRLYPGAVVRLGPAGSEVELRRGTVWAEVERERGRFAVRTEQAVAEVLGTSFVVEQRRNVTEVRVMRGVVEVRGERADGAVQLQGQQRTRVVRGLDPEPARRYQPDADRNAWDQFLRDLLRGLENGVREGLKLIEKALEGPSSQP